VLLSHKLPRNLTILAFVLRGSFYCAEQPMWEGFDEWAHFGYIQHLAQFRRMPSRNEPVSDEVRRSVELVPISAAAAESSPGSLTHDAFWRLPLDERLRRERELRALRPSYQGEQVPGKVLRQYEAQQPPLYYSFLALVYLAFQHDSLPVRVFALRIVTLLIGAVGIWLGCELAFKVPSSRRAAIPVLLLLVLSPGLLVDLTRIANDSLALTLGTAFLLCLFKIFRGESRLQDWMLAGAAMGAALLAKSYMLSLVPLLPLAALIEVLRGKLRLWQSAGRLLLALAFAAAIAGWWYVHAWQTTGTISGEQIDVAASR